MKLSLVCIAIHILLQRTTVRVPKDLESLRRRTETRPSSRLAVISPQLPIEFTRDPSSSVLLLLREKRDSPHGKIQALAIKCGLSDLTSLIIACGEVYALVFEILNLSFFSLGCGDLIFSFSKCI